MKVKFILTMLGLSYSLIGMGQAIDTVNLYKAKCGVPYKIYTYSWFIKPSLYSKSDLFEYSYNPKRETRQDSLVIEDYTGRKPYYFKVYDKRNRLIMEGGSNGPRAELLGDIKFYYSNGKLKRIEHWDSAIKDSCGGSFRIYDGPDPLGSWKYYRKDGRLKKEVDYFMNGCNGNDYITVHKKVTRFKRNGEVKSSVETTLR